MLDASYAFLHLYPHGRDVTSVGLPVERNGLDDEGLGVGFLVEKGLAPSAIIGSAVVRSSGFDDDVPILTQ